VRECLREEMVFSGEDEEYLLWGDGGALGVAGEWDRDWDCWVGAVDGREGIMKDRGWLEDDLTLSFLLARLARLLEDRLTGKKSLKANPDWPASPTLLNRGRGSELRPKVDHSPRVAKREWPVGASSRRLGPVGLGLGLRSRERDKLVLLRLGISSNSSISRTGSPGRSVGSRTPLPSRERLFVGGFNPGETVGATAE
jgi:hypothetical protein